MTSYALTLWIDGYLLLRTLILLSRDTKRFATGINGFQRELELMLTCILGFGVHPPSENPPVNLCATRRFVFRNHLQLDTNRPDIKLQVFPCALIPCVCEFRSQVLDRVTESNQRHGRPFSGVGFWNKR